MQTGDTFHMKAQYSRSWALIIGIDTYRAAAPLSYAVSDAVAVRDLLSSDFGFRSEDIVCLLDEQATKEAVLREYFRLASVTELDDRVVFFFAGHGDTRPGSHGEVGFLVPHDAEPDDLSSLIRWQELTQGAELISAKHMLFVMDACYSGLALTRAAFAGRSRFVDSMLRRRSRQVLTAGKADEVVADSGGPLPRHSVFTGHVIEGLMGKAVSENGILTANGLMAYVYRMVANDPHSHQTPDYGRFDGDGDMVLVAPESEARDSEPKADNEGLVVLTGTANPSSLDSIESKLSYAKSLLSADASFIKLHDFVMSQVLAFLSLTGENSFSLGSAYTDQEFLRRISSYEAAAGDLSLILADIAYWARPDHRNTLRKAVSRTLDRLDSRTGVPAWLALRWYPVILETYCAGIASVYGGRYDSLYDVFFASAIATEYGREESHLAGALGEAILALARMNAFQGVPGYEHNYAPMSEYLHKLLQPLLDDVLFMGKDYERVFDEFEVLLALVVADLRVQGEHGVWGPIGRFGWKHLRSYSPVTRLVEQARAAGPSWPPIQAGFFGGSIERFNAVATPYLGMIDGLGWL